MHIAWTHVAAQYPDEMPVGSSRIYEADIVDDGGTPKLAEKRLVLDSRDPPFQCTLECQNFVPPAERELTFSAYGHQGTDVCRIDLDTKKVVNDSDAPDQYDEVEGIASRRDVARTPVVAHDQDEHGLVGGDGETGGVDLVDGEGG